MRAACYARVSTTDQNPEMQADALLRECKMRGWEPVLFIERASGAAGASRPERERLMAGVACREFGAVLCWKLDRLGRSTVDVLMMVEQIQASGAVLVSLRDGVDATTAAGRFFLRVLVSVAEMERDFIGERVAAGIASAKAHGVHCGRHPRWLDWELYAMLRSEGRTLAQAAEIMRMSPRQLERRWACRRREGPTKPPSAAAAKTGQNPSKRDP